MFARITNFLCSKGYHWLKPSHIPAHDDLMDIEILKCYWCGEHWHMEWSR